jgi:hypothetical protein
MGMEVHDPQLERQGRRLGRAGGFWMAASLLFAIPGIVLLIVGFVVGPKVLWEVGIALLLIGGGPGVIGASLLGSSGVSRWASRHKLFA